MSPARRFSVDDEMETLFGPPTAAPAAVSERSDAAPGADDAAIPALHPARSRPVRLRAVAGTGLAAALVIGLVGSQWISSGRAGEAAAEDRVDGPVSVVPAPVIAAPRPAPVTTPEPALAAAPIPTDAPIEQAMLDAPTLPVDAEAPIAFVARPAPRIATRPVPPAPSAEPARPAPRLAVRNAPAPAARAPAARSQAACGTLAPGAAAECHYAAVLDADRQLVSAYDRAVEAGVSVIELRFYRRHWADARRAADEDPRYTIDSYEKMAHDLRLLTSRAQSAKLAMR